MTDRRKADGVAGTLRKGTSRVGHDGPALMFSTAATAAASLLFWVVAARTYRTESVGTAAAEIAAITMLAGLAQLNLLTVFVRFLASSGNRIVQFLSSGYVAITAASVIMGTAFVLLGFGSGFFSDDGTWEYVAFVLAVTVFALFVVQDGVLTVLGKAPWVPLENLAVAIARLAMLGLLIPALLRAGDYSRPGMVAAWCVPAGIAVCAVSVVIFGRLAPREGGRSTDHSGLPARRDIASFVFAEYLNNLVSNVITFVPPLLVLHLLGAAAAAYFNLPWLIVITTQTLLWNIGISFISESTRRPDEITTHLRHAMKLGAVVVIGGTVTLLAGAPVILGLQGADFAEEGTALLRLLALSLPCTAVVIMFSLLAMLQRRLWRLVLVNTIGAASLLAATTSVTGGAGIAVVGVIYLFVQTGLAGLLLPSLIVQLRTGSWLPQDSHPAARIHR